jgi:hypothetical protein
MQVFSWLRLATVELFPDSQHCPIQTRGAMAGDEPIVPENLIAFLAKLE